MNPIRSMVRQGDVLLVPVLSIPATATPRPRDAGRVILAYGEVTGHAHRIDAPDACGAALLDAPGNETFLTLDAVSQLLHEEHAAIPLAPGAYRVVRQREYSPAAIRYVAD
jgi:hypothetical protein